jgi:hypothetical protein
LNHLSPYGLVLSDEDCNNAQDDDRDGLVDCADPACTGVAACPAASCQVNADCSSNQYCRNQQCAATGACSRHAECAPNYFCLQSQCVVAGSCLSEAQCRSGERCQQGRCVTAELCGDSDAGNRRADGGACAPPFPICGISEDGCSCTESRDGHSFAVRCEPMDIGGVDAGFGNSYPDAGVLPPGDGGYAGPIDGGAWRPGDGGYRGPVDTGGPVTVEGSMSAHATSTEFQPAPSSTRLSHVELVSTKTCVAFGSAAPKTPRLVSHDTGLVQWLRRLPQLTQGRRPRKMLCLRC